jgi:hypothetical protein
MRTRLSSTICMTDQEAVAWDPVGREVKKMTKMVSLEKLQASGALDLDQMEEDLR